jgi:hypothetical protein
MLPHAAIHLKQCERLWLNPQQLGMGMAVLSGQNGLKVQCNKLRFKQPDQDTSLVKTMMLSIACKLISIENKK